MTNKNHIPLVSIITVCYNSKKHIQRCINSVKDQTYKKIEHIIIDGRSNDGTLDILKKNRDKKTVLISEKDEGIYYAMNKGLKQAKGDYIGFLNSDDFFSSNTVISLIVETLKNKEIDCIHANVKFVDDNLKIVRKWSSCEYSPGLFSKSWTPAHPTFYVKKNIINNLFFSTNYFIASDVEFMLKILEIKKAKSIYINKSLVTMQIGGLSTQGLASTIKITIDLYRIHTENNLSFNIFKYLFYKFIKFFNQKYLKLK